MGVGAAEPLYCLHNLETYRRSDTLPIKYMWLDKNVENFENKNYFEKFAKIFDISKFVHLGSLELALTITPTKNRVRIICSASFPDQVYDSLQNNEAIEKIALFCGNRTKAGILMRNYPRIKEACFGFEEVVRTLKFWEREQVENFYFFQEKDMKKLYRATICWHSLTDIDHSITPEIKDTFFHFCSKVLMENAAQARDLQARKIKDAASLVTYALEQNFLLMEINTLLRETKDPTKLAYIRWPVYEIFNFIKERYLEIKNKGSVSLYGVIALNTEEKRQLLPGKILNIIQFIKTSKNAPDRRTCETMIEIKVGPSQDICNGYYTAENGALFNIGNFYKIESFDESANNLTVSLMAFPKNHVIKASDASSQVLLNQLKIQNMEILKEGQWYSLIVSGKMTEAKEYLTRMQKLHRKREDSMQDIKWFLAREKVKVRNGDSVDKSLKKLELLMRDNQGDLQQCIIILTGIAQISLSERNYQKFSLCFLQLSSILSSPKGIKIPKDSHFNSKIQLMRMASEMIKEKESKYNLKEISKNIDRFQKSLIAIDNHRMASSLYFLCLDVKAQCFQLIEDYKSELEVLNLMIWILESVFSHDNYQLKTVLNQKKTAFEKMYPEESRNDLEMKKKLNNSKVSIEQLLSRNHLLNFDVSNIEIVQIQE